MKDSTVEKPRRERWLKNLRDLAIAIASVPVLLAPLAVTLAAAGGVNGLKRMYALDCGRLIAKDQSRWTPGVNAGQPREFSNNCYLFQHERARHAAVGDGRAGLSHRAQGWAHSA